MTDPTSMTDSEREEILDWIRSEHAAGRALNLHAVKRRRPELLRRVYEVRPFWGWWQAIADAGLDYADLEVELEETVTCRICGYVGFQLNAHLSRRHGMSSAEYREKYPGLDLASELRRARMKKEGGNHLLPHWEPLYSDEYMMDRAYRYYTMGHRLRTTWICEHDHNLWQHIHRKGITWESFITALGIPYPDAKTERAPGITREELLERLREVVKAEGETPKLARLTEIDHLLLTGVRRYFRNYDKALAAAGLPLPNRPFLLRREFSPEEVLAELRRLADQGVRITAVGIKKELGNTDLHLNIEKMGGYPVVRQQLGLAKPELPREMPRHTREEVIEAMRRRATEGKEYTVPALREGDEADPELLRSARQHFGKWTELLDAAGLQPVHHAKPRAQRRREKLLAALRERSAAGLPIDPKSMRQEESSKALYRNLSFLYKGWENAVAEVGLSEDLARSLSRERDAIIAAIQARQERGEPLDLSSMKSFPGSASLYQRARAEFKTWKKAILAAGIAWPLPKPPKPERPPKPPRPPKAERPPKPPKPPKAPKAAKPPRPGQRPRKPRVISPEVAAAMAARAARIAELKSRRDNLEERREKVIEAIRERHREKRPLYLRGIRREPAAMELYDEARVVFRTWKAALAAAGCKPEPLPPLPKSKIVQELEEAYPIDPEWLAKVEEMTAATMLRRDTDEPEDAPAKPSPDFSPGVIRGWRRPTKKGEKQRTTPSKAELRKKRKKGRR